jgi:hypothetical protein
MISLEEIRNLISSLGMEIEESSSFINGKYDALCLVIYDKDENVCSVWNRENGFNDDEEDLEIVKKKLIAWITYLKQQKMDIKMEKIKEMF